MSYTPNEEEGNKGRDYGKEQKFVFCFEKSKENDEKWKIYLVHI